MNQNRNIPCSHQLVFQPLPGTADPASLKYHTKWGQEALRHVRERTFSSTVIPGSIPRCKQSHPRVAETKQDTMEDPPCAYRSELWPRTAQSSGTKPKCVPRCCLGASVWETSPQGRRHELGLRHDMFRGHLGKLCTVVWRQIPP